MGLGSGSPVAILRLGDGLILLPEDGRFDRLGQKVVSNLTSAGPSEDILATLPEARIRVYARRYGETVAGKSFRRRPGGRRGK